MSDSITATAEYNELLDSIKQTLAAGRPASSASGHERLVAAKA
jgi:hypothetical protein